jgi:hypothetical protein
MSEEIHKDPVFRDQYAGGIGADPEVEAALGGPNAPRITMPPVTRPLGGVQWMGAGPVRLR